MIEPGLGGGRPLLVRLDDHPPSHSPCVSALVLEVGIGCACRVGFMVGRRLQRQDVTRRPDELWEIGLPRRLGLGLVACSKDCLAEFCVGHPGVVLLGLGLHDRVLVCRSRSCESTKDQHDNGHGYRSSRDKNDSTHDGTSFLIREDGTKGWLSFLLKTSTAKI